MITAIIIIAILALMDVFIILGGAQNEKRYGGKFAPVSAESIEEEEQDLKTEKTARIEELERTCEYCYYSWCDEYAYPCSRCTHNDDLRDLYRPVEDWRLP